jgi:hypothetical protein
MGKDVEGNGRYHRIVCGSGRLVLLLVSPVAQLF